MGLRQDRRARSGRLDRARVQRRRRAQAEAGGPDRRPGLRPRPPDERGRALPANPAKPAGWSLARGFEQSPLHGGGSWPRPTRHAFLHAAPVVRRRGDRLGNPWHRGRRRARLEGARTHARRGRAIPNARDEPHASRKGVVAGRHPVRRSSRLDRRRAQPRGGGAAAGQRRHRGTGRGAPQPAEEQVRRASRATRNRAPTPRARSPERAPRSLPTEPPPDRPNQARRRPGRQRG